MRSIPAPLQAHLDTGATTLARCWRLTRRDGQSLGFTDHDRALTFGGLRFEPSSGLSASEVEGLSGLAPDNAEAIGALSSDALTEADIERGLYDDAAVSLFLVNWRALAQRVQLFEGTLGEVSRGETAFRAELRGMAQALDQPTGRAFLPQCDAELGDTRCTVSATATPGAISAIDQPTSFRVSGLGGLSDGWFSRGLLTWTSGANAGLDVPVMAHRKAAGVSLDLWTPLPDPPAIGDGFTVKPGCDKQLSTCAGKFENAINFRGFPFIPGNDFAQSYPNRGERNDGGALR